MAPPGYRLVVVDLSNIELRMCHYLCGETETIAALHRGEDLYCNFSSVFYGRQITKADKKERQHGKVAMLQLQFQAGAESFRRAARIMAGVRLNELEAQTTVDVYRATYQGIVGMWRRGQKAIPRCAAGGGFYLDDRELVYVEHNALRLPNGMRLQYHNLRQQMLQGFDGLEELVWVYDDKESRGIKKTYGGVFGVQGPTQALSRNVVMEMQNDVERKYGAYERRGEGVVLSVHDEMVVLVREDRAEECLDFVLARMHESPKWAPDLPLAAEGGIGIRYADVK
jgi:DNA polymerase